ncbi:serine/threonine protein kinase [Oxynema sp. CENA135]|uniref:protein kinase domain-containing protein n=1 Tax=Oxynema sp. CENA135 TaxID=984206 RepID=UPI00190A9296|nr:serine/threonine protein kinase [Oxynema sp. CENA135]
MAFLSAFMSYCINPNCPDPHNPDEALFCRTCGLDLHLQGRYRVVGGLKTGGFSHTYEAIDRATPKVLKVLDLANFGRKGDREKALRLFDQEGRVLSELNHPGIPKVDATGHFTVTLPDGEGVLHCLVMQKMAGLNLEDWVADHGCGIDEGRAIAWLWQLIDILDAVHRQHFFHRDIKPSNIMLQPSGNLALIDFGSVRSITRTYLANIGHGLAGTAIVSKGYAPPEQENGWAVEQSDFFALGRTFVYLLTAEHPLTFYDAYTDELRWRSRAPQIGDDLADLVDRLMAHLPQQRPPSTAAIARELAAIGSPDLPRGTTLQPTPSPQIELVRTLKGHRDAVWSVAIGPRSRFLVSASWDCTIQVWNLATGQRLRTLAGHQDAVWAIALSADGNTLVSTSSDRTVKIWHLPSGQLLRTLHGHGHWVTCVALSPDGETIASGSSDKTVKIWHLPTGKLLHTLQAHTYAVTCVAIAPDGHTLASGSGDKTIKFWDLRTGQLQRTLLAHSASVTCLCFSPDGRTLASGTVNKTLKLWDVTTGQRLHLLVGHSDKIWAVAIAPDGQTLIGASRDRTIECWDLSDGSLKAILNEHSSSVNAVAISEDGQLLASGSNDCTIKIWSLGA